MLSGAVIFLAVRVSRWRCVDVIVTFFRRVGGFLNIAFKEKLKEFVSAIQIFSCS